MSIYKHTPGPWEIHEGRSEGFAILSGERVVASTEDEFGHFGAVRHEADAHLIVSASDLLEALRTMMMDLEDAYMAEGFDVKSSSAYQQAERAIAKAMGEKS